ncbi:MAG: carbohydrate ABC transporter permease [Gemmatimonadetes bacterium]|jgi:putative aldouronate transport system permease protein|nr:carbohydrate ABC transporter permease [Gemmatimonadota bacterium]MDE0965120.1 carbohydrate ABC transporter permease [Candidatus Latescibacterota bacterium]MBT5327297.1 carbohydrate ABC transporter permease [Gemmatimonadota bacterium]MBT5449143.1 carbohydrate ABC transporter permease [Gemmatimonadota bacterium]MBT5801196.1 carbohydrate ABC transporter permease [Gemmatimonadota bacterium]|tara:strand:+ start:1066 stop:1944 length:879 start_codon:yes stop_codon:yes gene_type:complete
MIQRTRGERIFNVFNVTVLGVVALMALYPFVYTISMSLSSAAEAMRSGLHLYPRDISLTSFEMVLANPDIVSGFANSVLRTVSGTALTLFFTCLTAYPLARKELPYRGPLLFLILFTMIFSGGIVPNYLLIKNIGLIDSIWALILPHMLTAFNVIVMKNFFQSIPESLAESAKIDGASEINILARIYVPLSKPVLATVGLWTAVSHWNQWFDAMLYITSDENQVLQTFLQRIVIESSVEMIEQGLVDPNVTQFTPETIKAATVVVTVLPMLLIYPFVQKYFVKGIMLGGVKE